MTKLIVILESLGVGHMQLVIDGHIILESQLNNFLFITCKYSF